MGGKLAMLTVKISRIKLCAERLERGENECEEVETKRTNGFKFKNGDSGARCMLTNIHGNEMICRKSKQKF